jgi:predicted metal-dependent HD superfamily phosphohydrolase
VLIDPKLWQWMEARWHSWWVAADPEHQERRITPEYAFRMVAWHYADPRRSYYHGLPHIEHCLMVFDSVKSNFVYPIIGEASLWLHDVIMDTKSKENEEKSAAFARTMMHQWRGLDFWPGYLASHEILATKHDLLVDQMDLDSMIIGDAKLVCDIDLSALACDYSIFAADVANIRREYEWLSEDEWVAGRGNFLKKMLDREVIYQTELFRDFFETKARANLARSLGELQ